MADFQSQDFYKYADDETKAEIRSLEKSLKSNELYVNLGEHDAVKLMRAAFNGFVEKYNRFLQEQSYEDLATEAGRVKRARLEAYRDSWRWFENVFTISKARVEDKLGKVENLKKGSQNDGI